MNGVRTSPSITDALEEKLTELEASVSRSLAQCDVYMPTRWEYSQIKLIKALRILLEANSTYANEDYGSSYSDLRREGVDYEGIQEILESERPSILEDRGETALQAIKEVEKLLGVRNETL